MHSSRERQRSEILLAAPLVNGPPTLQAHFRFALITEPGIGPAILAEIGSEKTATVGIVVDYEAGLRMHTALGDVLAEYRKRRQ
jgi:hypothetical protein